MNGLTMVHRWLMCLGFLCGVLLLAGGARAQAAPERSELEQQRNDALSAIEAGRSTPHQLVPLYLALARATALLGEGDEARRAFGWVLALLPSFRLERSEVDAIRSPYLEARGEWSARSVALSASLVPGDDGGALRVVVTDPAGLAARVRVRARLAGEGEFVEVVRAPTPDLTIALEGLADAPSVAFSVALLDAYGNRIFERGSDERPEHLVLKQAAAPRDAPAVRSANPERPAPLEPGSPSRAARFYTAGALTMALGAGALSWGVVEHMHRERLASRYNRGDCDGDGVTRAEVCERERSDLSRAQTRATVLYAAGGATLTAGLVLLLLAPRRSSARRDQHALACTSGVTLREFTCTLRF